MASGTDDRPTLKSLAKITGLGISTVSQALRNSPAISEETRRRVQLAAQQAGYRPNRAGVRLRTGRSNVITVILNPQDAGSGFFADFVYGVASGILGTPYHLVITPYDHNDQMAPVRYVVETASADGVIISRIMPNDPRVRYMAENGMPFATHGRTEMGISHPYHDYDNEAFAYEAVRQLALRGRRRIALVAPPPDLTYFHHTHAGFERALRDFKLEQFPLATLSTDTALSEIEVAGRETASHANRPDGIVSAATSSAFALAAGFKNTGLVVGKDFDVATKHSSPIVRIAMPEMIYVEEDFKAAGRDLAQILIRSINGEPTHALQHVVGPGGRAQTGRSTAVVATATQAVT
jgi:LacI family transcriptional regulator